METQKETNAPPILPDSTTYNTDPTYLRSLLERANLTQRAAAQLIGMHERSMRYVLTGQREIDYPSQYALEVLARGGVADTPQAPPAWFKAAQRPLRKDDVGRIVVGRHRDGGYLVGRVTSGGFGLAIEPLPGFVGLDGTTLGASVLADYVLIDGPQS